MILQFIDGLRGDVHVTFEEGTWATWLCDLLKPRVTRVVVCDAVVRAAGALILLAYFLWRDEGAKEGSLVGSADRILAPTPDTRENWKSWWLGGTFRDLLTRV